MTETITAFYDTFGKAHAAADDLISTGIDNEKVYLDDRVSELKVMVMVPDAIKGEIMEILQRHKPLQLNETPVA